MITRIFKIQQHKGISKTKNMLREQGITIYYDEFISLEGRMNPEKPSHALLIKLMKEGKITCKTNKTMLRNTDKYYTGWLNDRKYALKEQRAEYARKFTENFHLRCKSLYTSQRASVMVQYDVFNENRLQNKDWNAYSKSYGHPAVWKDAAVVILPDKSFDVYNSRGKFVENFPIPHIKTIQERLFNHPALNEIGRSMYAVWKDKKTVKIYDKNDAFICYGQLKPDPAGNKKLSYWEHGSTLQQITNEYNRKKEIARKQAEKIAEQKKLTQEQARIYRAQKLIMKLVNNYPVSFSDARNVGYCLAGIKNFCLKNGIEFSETAKVNFGFLRKFPETQRLRQSMAEKLANHLFTK